MCCLVLVGVFFVALVAWTREPGVFWFCLIAWVLSWVCWLDDEDWKPGGMYDRYGMR